MAGPIVGVSSEGLLREHVRCFEKNMKPGGEHYLETVFGGGTSEVRAL